MGVIDFNSANEYLKLVNEIITPQNVTESLRGYAKYISQSELQNHFSAPMVWIGMYVAAASLVCILAMVADLLYGLGSRKLWFPCRFFRVNAFFLTVIAVAMKLPVDLTGLMMGRVDKEAKLGSMAFMCTIMANLLPFLAAMSSNDLLSNITALCVLVITMVVNVCIQIRTGVLCAYIYNNGQARINTSDALNILASIYVLFLVVLLIVQVCSSVAILGYKNIVESKYQQGHDEASKEITGKLPSVEELQRYVTNHWIMIMIMAGSHDISQLIASCFPTACASGVICLLVIFFRTYTMFCDKEYLFDKEYGSDYGWSTMVIRMVQFIGVVIGTIAPLSRCFSFLKLRVPSKIILNHFRVFKIEGYWTHKLYDWKQASIRLPFRSRNLKVIVETLKGLIFNLFIGLQIGVVVVCKVVALIPFLFMIYVVFCFRFIKGLLAVFLPWRKKFEMREGNNIVRPYVSKPDDEMELGESTLARHLKSVYQLIQKGEESQPNNLRKLLEISTRDFQGVQNFNHTDDHDISSCWRLSVVTLTTIAVSLPEIEKDEVDSLLKSVREGLEYVTVVEKSLNVKDCHVRFQKVADILWKEITSDNKWLGNLLQDPNFQMKSAGQIVEWLRDKAEIIVCNNTREEMMICYTSYIFASSMYCITKTILLPCYSNNDSTINQKELFNSLVSMIADIIAACLTNLPQAITMKCHTSVIEEREDSVKDAAQLLGQTTKIIDTLRGYNIPNMNPSDLPYINKWRDYLGNP